MGDEEIYTDEERDILGIEGDDQDGTLAQDPDNPDSEIDGTDEGGEEPTETKEAADTDETEHKEEGQAEDLSTARIEGKYLVYEDGTKIPLTRFTEVYRDAKESARRLELIKEVGPEEYFRLYPDEAPEAKTEPEAETEPEPADPLMGLGETTITGGPYDGWTLNQVFEVNPVAGNLLLMNHMVSVQGEIDAQREAEEKYKADAEKETNQLVNQLAQEMFGAKDSSALKADQMKTVEAEVERTLKWMETNNKLHFALGDAYFLMNKDDIIKRARAQGAKETIASIARPNVPSIKVGAGSASADGVLEDMTDDELSDFLEALPESKYAAFLRNAPQKLKQRRPDLPWE